MKFYDKRDDYDFDIVNFPFLDGGVLRATLYSIYISQLIRFTRASNQVSVFNNRKLLSKGTGIIKHYPNSIIVILNHCSNITLVWKHFCKNVCPNLKFIAT